MLVRFARHGAVHSDAGSVAGMGDAGSASRRVALYLIKCAEGEAAVAVLEVDHPDLVITDRDTFYSVEGIGQIEVDLRRLSEELGTHVSMSRWLLALSSYVGRVVCEEQLFSVTADALDPTV